MIDHSDNPILARMAQKHIKAAIELRKEFNATGDTGALFGLCDAVGMIEVNGQVDALRRLKSANIIASYPLPRQYRGAMMRFFKLTPKLQAALGVKCDEVEREFEAGYYDTILDLPVREEF